MRLIGLAVILTCSLLATPLDGEAQGRIGLSEFTRATTPSRPGEIQWGAAWVG